MDNTQEVQVAYKHLQEYLIQNFDAKYASGKSEVVKRCHRCGDSGKHSSRHMYIGINKRNQIVYNCFLCNAGGLVDAKFFRDLGIYEVDLINEVIQANASGFTQYQSNNVRHKRLVPFNAISYDLNNIAEKLLYIQSRIGIPMSPDMINQFKIVPSILTFLRQHGINYYTRDVGVMQELDRYFVGFLSIDNSHIIMRRIIEDDSKLSPTIRSRYVVYNINQYNKTGVSFYAIPGMLDKYKSTEIVITEGIFDILSVATNVYNCIADPRPRDRNYVYAAACGKTSYSSLLEYLFVAIGVPYLGARIEIYSDNDINMRDLQAMKDMYATYGVDIYIHFNRYDGEKDFGVPGDRIVDYRNKITDYH